MSLSGSAYPAWQTNVYREPQQPWWHDTLLGPLELVTPPAGLVLPASDALLHCRQDNTTDAPLVAGYIQSATEYCERSIEGERQFLSATYDQPIAPNWTGQRVQFQRPPVQELVSVSYYDTQGDVQTLDTGLFLVRKPWRQAGSIERLPFKVWPPQQWDRRYPMTARLVCGYGPNTTVALAISTGSQTVAPASMYGIYAGTQLVVGEGATQERVTVASVTASTFTATFALAHASGVALYPGIPPTVRQAVLMLVGSWYRNREAVGQVGDEIAFSVNALLARSEYGSYA